MLCLPGGHGSPGPSRQPCRARCCPGPWERTRLCSRLCSRLICRSALLLGAEGRGRALLRLRWRDRAGTSASCPARAGARPGAAVGAPCPKHSPAPLQRPGRAGVSSSAQDGAPAVPSAAGFRSLLTRSYKCTFPPLHSKVLCN